MNQRILPSEKFKADIKEHKSFFDVFDVEADNENLFAVTKCVYPHLCPDGKTRNFKYIFKGSSFDDSCFMGLYFVPSVEHLSRAAKKFIVDDHRSLLQEEFSTKDISEISMGASFTDENYPLNVRVFFPCLYKEHINYLVEQHVWDSSLLDESKMDSFVHDGNTYYYPEVILDDISSMLPYFDERFDFIMASPDIMHECPFWDKIKTILK